MANSIAARFTMAVLAVGLVSFSTTVLLAPFDVAQGDQARRRYDRLCDVALEHGIDVWRLDHLFCNIPTVQLRVNSMDTHPNERAHALVGRELAQKVLPMLIGGPSNVEARR